MTDKLILASASPRRKELLQQIGLEFEVIPSTITESIDPTEPPEETAIRLSLEKAREVAERPEISARWIIGSDTIVVYQQQMLGKPQDQDDAASMLKTLSGCSHRVISGYAVIDRLKRQERSEAVTTIVHFRHLTDVEITSYIATGEPFDKAGAYAIQGIGACFVSGIEGSYSNVVGLPLCRLSLTLKQLGVPLPI